MAKEVIRNADGKPFSSWKATDKFGWTLRHKYREFSDVCQREFKFHPTRRWRMDYAWPDVQVCVEIDGFGFGHQSQQGMSGDNEKQNAAVGMGWRVFRFNSRDLGSKANVEAAVELVCGFIENIP